MWVMNTKGLDWQCNCSDKTKDMEIAAHLSVTCGGEDERGVETAWWDIWSSEGQIINTRWV